MCVVCVCARGVCERVCMCVVCVCAIFVAQFNLSSIQIFHSDGKRPQLSLGSVPTSSVGCSMSVYVRVYVCGVCVCVCVCVCVLSSWHSSTNLSSIQIFHSDGKRPQLSLGSVANF